MFWNLFTRNRNTAPAPPEETIRSRRTWERDPDSVTVVPEYYLRLLVVGAAGVGKSSIIRRFVYDDFRKPYDPTIGVDQYCVSGAYKFRNSRALLRQFPMNVRVQILDVPNTELRPPRHRRPAPANGGIRRRLHSLRDRDGINDLSGERSEFLVDPDAVGSDTPNLDHLLETAHGVMLVFDITSPSSVRAVDHWRRRISRGTLCLLVANKADRSVHRHVVDPNELISYVLNGGYIGWYMTSCKNRLDTDVFDAFDYLVACICKRMLNRFSGLPSVEDASLFQLRREEFQEVAERRRRQIRDGRRDPNVNLADDLLRDDHDDDDDASSARNLDLRASLSCLLGRWSKIDEMVERAPFSLSEIPKGYGRGRSRSRGGGRVSPSPEDGQSGLVAARRQAFRGFRSEFSEFYRQLRSRFVEYQKMVSDGGSLLINGILLEIDHEWENFRERLGGVEALFAQTEELNLVNNRRFMDLKREFYMIKAPEWTRLFVAMKNYLFVRGRGVTVSPQTLSEFERIVKSHSIIRRHVPDREDSDRPLRVLQYPHVSNKLDPSSSLFPSILAFHRDASVDSPDDAPPPSFGFSFRNVGRVV